MVIIGARNSITVSVLSLQTSGTMTMPDNDKSVQAGNKLNCKIYAAYRVILQTKIHVWV
jgi:hypothetical protein